MNRSLLLIALFIIVLCWKFKIFETKHNTNSFVEGNLKLLLQNSDDFKTTLRDSRNPDNESSLNSVFTTGMSATSNESEKAVSQEVPCKSEASTEIEFDFDKLNLNTNVEMLNISSDTLKDEMGNLTKILTSLKNPSDISEASGDVDFHFDKSNWDTNVEIFNLSSKLPKEDIGNTSIIVSKLSKNQSHVPEVTIDSYVDFDQHNLIMNNNSINLQSNYTNTESRFPDIVKESNSPTIFLKEESLISKATTNTVKTADDISEFYNNTEIIESFVSETSSNRENSFQDHSTNGDSSMKPNLEKSGSIKNQLGTNYISKKGDNDQILDYIYEMYDVVQATFAKLEEVHQLVRELMSGIEHVQTKNQRLPSDDDTKCTFYGNLEQHQTNLELLVALKLNIDRGFNEVDEAMSDLASHLSFYEELHQSNSHDTEMFKTARIAIFTTMRTLNLLMNNVQKDANKFLKYVPEFKIICN